MKIYKTTQYFSLVLFMAIVIGCTQLTGGKAISSPIVPASSINNVPPKETATLSLTPVPTNTIAPSLTPITVPTLPAEDARKRMLELLANNGDCHLPCLWGITPGQSNYQEARIILIPLSGIAETAYFDYTPYPEDDITPLYVEDDLRLNARVLYLYGKDSIVSLITFQVLEEQLIPDSFGNFDKLPVFDSATFAKRVQYYSLSHVLSEQGIPDSVLMHASNLPDPVIAGGMEIALLYPEQGIAVNYKMLMYNQGKIKKGCPAIAHVDMVLYPPGNPASFFSELEKTDWGRVHKGDNPMEEVTTLSVEEFYQTFRNPTDTCIETPANLWPTPEP